MRSLILQLDRAAPSFCYYDPPAPSATPAGGEPMSPEVLEAALAFADAHDLALQVLAGPGGVPDEVRQRLARRPVAFYVPAAADPAPDDVVVLDLETANPAALEPAMIEPALIEPGRHLIAILRVAPDDLGRWAEVWAALAPRVQRVVVVLRGLDRLTEGDLARHAESLRRAACVLEEQLRAGRGWELNLLTDRMLLTEPAECGAGLEHLTVAPDGRLYLCPGFVPTAGDDDQTAAVGRLPEGPRIVNRRLLARERAPICAVCDAFHCRRCVHLNQRATLELNTPPWQACRAAHLEREASRRLLSALGDRAPFGEVAPIPRLSYDDPLEKLTGRKMRQPPVERPAPPPADEPTHDRHREEPSSMASQETTKREPVGRVTPEERDEIRQIFLRKSALSELFLTLAKLDQRSLEASPLYEKVVRDMGETADRFQTWWDNKAKAYGWQGRAGGSWSIDFASCEVFLD